MGAWGPQIFENDDAADWLGDYAEIGPDAVIAAFDDLINARDEGYIEAPTASMALAAAEAVAHAIGSPAETLTSDEVEIFETHAAALATVPGIADRARIVVEAVDSGEETSELIELWAEGEAEDVGTASFTAALADLRARLT